jgi:hypothetical protein
LSFISGTDYIADTDEVRRLARNTVNADFDNNQIISYQVKEWSYIRSLIHSDSVLVTDRIYRALQLQEIRRAAADVIDHYGIGTSQQIAASKSLRDEFIRDMFGSTNGQGVNGGIIGNLPTESQSPELDEGIDLETSLYESYPASLRDGNVRIYRSTSVNV